MIVHHTDHLPDGSKLELRGGWGLNSWYHVKPGGIERRVQPYEVRDIRAKAAVAVDRVRAVLDRCVYPGFSFEVQDQERRPHLRMVCIEGTCNVSGQALEWKGRWWRLSPHMTDGEIVQTAFKAVLTALEHEARERFTVDGVPIFQPHFDLDAIIAFASDPANTKEREHQKA